MPTLDFKGKQHIYAHHLTVPYGPIETDENFSCNPDTEYKRKVLKALEGAFNAVGTMRLRDGSKSIFQLVFSEDEFPEITERLREQYSHS